MTKQALFVVQSTFSQQHEPNNIRALMVNVDATGKPTRQGRESIKQACGNWPTFKAVNVQNVLTPELRKAIFDSVL